MNRLALTILALLGLATAATHAEPTSPRRARATPPYVLRAPTAFMPPAGSVELDASAARQALHGRALYGLGDVAAVGTSLTLPGLACDPCAHELSFEFRSGTHHTVGLTTLGWAYRLQLHNPATADRQVQLTGIASLVRPTWAIHGGPTYVRTAHGHLLRPWAAVQWRAPQVPRTTLALEWQWASRLATSAATPPVWHLGWGVTYHALTTVDVALLVNHEQAQGLGAAQIYLGARWYPGGQR